MSTISAAADVLGRIAINLKSRDEHVAHAAARELATHVAFVASELKGEGMAQLNSELSRMILSLTHSPHRHEKLAGITVIENLVGIDADDNSARLYRFYQYLKPNLPCNDAVVMIEASKALGQLCKHGGHWLGDQFFEYEVARVLDFLTGERERNESGRYAAVLIIKEMARSAPHVFHTYVNRVLDKIWVALRDTRVLVREGAAEALGACLQIIAQREKQMGLQACENIYEEAERGLKVMTLVEAIHGSLLAIQELLQHSKTVSMDESPMSSNATNTFHKALIEFLSHPPFCSDSSCGHAFIVLATSYFGFTSIATLLSGGQLRILCPSLRTTTLHTLPRCILGTLLGYSPIN